MPSLNDFRRYPLTLTLLLLASWTATSVFGQANSPTMRYGWKQGQTYMYNVQVEADRGDYLEVLSGNPNYNVTSADRDNIKFTFTGTLMESTKQKPGKNVIVVGPPRLRSPFSPLGGVGIGGLGRPHEITINPRGEIVSMQGSSQLPFLLGNLSELMLELLPEKNEPTWTTSKDTAITLSNSMFPRPIFRNEDRQQIKATERTTYTLEKVNGDFATIQKIYELRTAELTNGKPRFEIAGRGPITFDVKQGTPVAMEFQQTFAVREGNNTEETGLKITYKLLDSAEAAKIKTAAEEARKVAESKQKEAAKPFEGSELTTSLDDLKSGDQGKLIRALSTFQNKKPAEPNAAVAKALESLLTSNNLNTRNQAAKALENWATTDSAASLATAIESKDLFVRHSAMKALARIAPADGAELIAERMNELSDRAHAAKVLQEIGSAAEPATLKMLSHKEWQVRWEAVKVLKEIGTKKSLDPLKPLQTKDENIFVRQTSGQAIEAIQKRDK
jgi:HEAT repeat protein